MKVRPLKSSLNPCWYAAPAGSGVAVVLRVNPRYIVLRDCHNFHPSFRLLRNLHLRPIPLSGSHSQPRTTLHSSLLLHQQILHSKYRIHKSTGRIELKR